MNMLARHLSIAAGCVLQTLLFSAVAHAATSSAANPMPQTLAFERCSWDHPGVNPFMGDVVAAVDRYRDIPPEVRQRLKERMAKREYDDLVSIRRDRIDGRGGYDYGSTISEMHFGTHQLCHSVTRTSWTPEMEERGLVYCESGQCILVPTVCRNVSRISRSGVGDQAAAVPPLLAAAPEAPADGLPPIDWFGPTGAGLPGDVPVGSALGGGFGPAGFEDGPGAWPVLGGGGPLFFAGGDGGGGGGGGFIGGPGFGAPILGALVPGSPFGNGGPGAGPTPAVPEPHTWALMALGVAAIGLAVRRRPMR